MPVLAVLLSLQSSFARLGETIIPAPRADRPRTDTAADVVVVTAEQLAATNERSLPRQLAKAAGVWVQETNLGGGAPLLQGLSGAQILLVVDGVRMNDATTRNGVNQMLNGIDPAAVERVEVIRGPRSVLYGSDALGGVILVWTKRARPHGGEGLELSAAWDAQYATPTNGYATAVELAGATGGFGAFIAGSWHEWNELQTAEGELPNTGYSGGGTFGSVETLLGARSSLRATASWTRDVDVPRTDRLNPGFGQTNPSNAEFLYAAQDRRRYVLTYDDRSAGPLADQVQVRGSLREYTEERRLRAFGSSTRRFEVDETSTVGLSVDLKKALGTRHLLTYGFDVDHDDVDASRTNRNVNTGVTTPAPGAFAPGSRYTTAGFFAQDEILLDGFDLTLGARYSHSFFGFEDPAGDESGDFGALSGSLALGREIAPDVRVVGTLARGFRAPNLAELARNATFASGEELRNPDLEPETSLYGELALERSGADWSGAVALFAQRIEDAVGRVLIDPGAPGPGDEVFLRRNIGWLELVGLQARGRLALGGVDSPWSASAGIEWIYGRQDDEYTDPDSGEQPFADQPAQRIPPLHGFVALRHERAAGWIDWVELTTNWAFSQHRLAPQDLEDPRIDPDGTDGWVTLDLDVGGPIGGEGSASSWSVGLHNLLDASYRVHGSGVDGPGIGLVVGLRIAR
ncbi:MAG: TonB-dependent receptor [Planctomycetes bacterium]|nr:TonB-dependent receptor [Planctomycetota bacterium]